MVRRSPFNQVTGPDCSAPVPHAGAPACPPGRFTASQSVARERDAGDSVLNKRRRLLRARIWPAASPRTATHLPTSWQTVVCPATTWRMDTARADWSSSSASPDGRCRPCATLDKLRRDLAQLR
ncbi:hypothetical protein MRX96_055435 [Rhipicephalus microplus]